MTNFELIATTYFKSQFESFDLNERKKIQKRLLLLKENPFRNKSIHSQKFGKLFRIRIEINSIESRIIYVVIGLKIVIAGILDRRKNYSDLEELLRKLSKEIN